MLGLQGNLEIAVKGERQGHLRGLRFSMYFTPCVFRSH
jgi:hypothetical protein